MINTQPYITGSFIAAATIATAALPFISNDLWAEENATQPVIIHAQADCGVPPDLTPADSDYLCAHMKKACDNPDQGKPEMEIPVPTEYLGRTIPEGYTWGKLECQTP